MNGPESAALLHAVAAAERGPRRDGAFAVWLVVRVVGDLAGETEWPERPRWGSWWGRCGRAWAPTPPRRFAAL